MNNPTLSHYSLVNKIWNSPTITTWGSFSATLLGWVLLLPIALNRLTTSEIALWYFFRIIFDLRPIIDIGFSPTFIRQIAYAYGGSETINEFAQNAPNKIGNSINWDLIEATYKTMDFIYIRLAFLLFFILCTVGTLLAVRTISLVENQNLGWVSWGIVVLTTSVFLRGNSYSTFLQGSNNVALYRRWEAIFALAAIPTGVIILLLGGGLLGLVISEQFWLIVSVLRNKFLAQKISEFKIISNSGQGFSKVIFSLVWPLSWRSGIGILMGYGVMQFSGLVYAQVGDTSSVAAYLLSLRFAQNISAFSRVPFYSHLPQLATLFASNQIDELVRIARRGMRISHWIYSLGFIGFGLIAPWALSVIKSNAQFVPQSLWALIGLAFFAERYGAMHIQLFTLTNRVVWHIANGITGVITLVLVWITFGKFRVYAFPLGYAIANIGFYAWYSARLSYKTFRFRFREFEVTTLLIPLSIFMIFVAISLIRAI